MLTKKGLRVLGAVALVLTIQSFVLAAGEKSSTEAYLESLHNQGKERVIVRFEGQIDPDLVTKYQGKVIRKLKIINAVVCEINQSNIELLKQEENVKDAVADRLIRVPTPQREIAYPTGKWEVKAKDVIPLVYDGNVPLEWNHSEAGSNSQAAWNNYDLDGNGIKIAFIDTGIQYTLPDLENHYLGGWDFVDDDNDPLPPNANEYHGTEITSLAVAEGVSQMLGSAYKAKFYAIRVLEGENAVGLVSDGVAGIEWAMDPDSDPNTDDVPDIISMSLGTYSSGGAVEDLLAACNAAYEQGIVLVAASGNDGLPFSLAPARFENVISVGAHEVDQTILNYLYVLSNGGVDIVAPGADVKVIDPDASIWHGWGTSYAVPHASALIALQMQHARHQNIDINNGYNWEVMKHGAIELTDDNPLYQDPNLTTYQGKGKIYAAQTDINDANIGSIDLIYSNWPIDYVFNFFDYAFIDANYAVYQIGSDVNQSITLTNITDILGNTTETIEDLDVVTTQIYYSDPNDQNLPGSSVTVFPTVSSLEPNDANSIIVSLLYTILPETAPGLIRTKLELEFNFVGNGRTIEVSYNGPVSLWYAAIPADLDLDDYVNLIDFSILAKMWHENDCTEPNWCERADVDRSGDVGLSDVKVFADNWLVGVEPQDFLAVDCYAANPNDILNPAQTVHEGQEVRICFKLRYTGSGASADIRVQIDGEIPFDFNDSFTPGTYVYSFPWIATTGAHRIRGWCDFNSEVMEKNENNNDRDENPSFLVLPISDFAAVDCYAANPNDISTPLQTVNEGQDVNICFKFNYTGLEKTAITRIQLDDQTPFDVNGSFTNGTYVYSFPWTATVGDHRVRGWCDFNDDVSETNEGNNYRDENPSFSVLLMPDFAAVDCYAANPNDISTPLQTINEGQDVNICFKFDYTGSETMAVTRVQLDDLTPFDVNGSFTTGSYVYSFSWTATAGEHRVRGWCDFNDEVTEANESNNYLDENPCFSVIPPSTVLLIHCDGNDGSQSFIDSSPSAHGITTYGDAQVDTATVKFGTGSLMLDGNGDCLTIPDSDDWDIGGSSEDNWTIDLWVKHTSHSDYERYIAQIEDDDKRWILDHRDGYGISFHIRLSGVYIVSLPRAGEITDTNWHHVALCKVGSEYAIYLDGQQVNYTNDPDTNIFIGDLTVGATPTATYSMYFDGHMDEIRIQRSNYFNANPNPSNTDTITVPVQ